MQITHNSSANKWYKICIRHWLQNHPEEESDVWPPSGIKKASLQEKERHKRGTAVGGRRSELFSHPSVSDQTVTRLGLIPIKQSIFFRQSPTSRIRIPLRLVCWPCLAVFRPIIRPLLPALLFGGHP